jgi:hypothetical protein
MNLPVIEIESYLKLNLFLFVRGIDLLGGDEVHIRFLGSLLLSKVFTGQPVFHVIKGIYRRKIAVEFNPVRLALLLKVREVVVSVFTLHFLVLMSKNVG